MRRHYGVCDGRFKLIHFYEPSVDEWELFDLHHDPKELCSVYGVEKYATDQARLKEQLARLQDELELPRPDPPESYRGGEKRYRKAVERMQEKLEKLQSD